MPSSEYDRASTDSQKLGYMAEALVSALQMYTREVDQGILAHDSPQIVGLRNALTDALLAFDDAHVSLTGAAILEDKCLESGSQRSVEDGNKGHVMSILSRIDYRVNDFSEVIAEGRRSYMQNNPSASGDEANSVVDDIGPAIYEILHENGDVIPFPFPAARPIAGITWFMRGDEALSQKTEEDPIDPFSVAEADSEECLFVHRDIYFLSPDLRGETGEVPPGRD